MKTIKYFKAQKSTKKFNKNQKVWVVLECANHLFIKSKWRGKGRMVFGYLSKWNGTGKSYNPIIGDKGISSMEIGEDFYNRLNDY